LKNNNPKGKSKVKYPFLSTCFPMNNYKIKLNENNYVKFDTTLKNKKELTLKVETTMNKETVKSYSYNIKLDKKSYSFFEKNEDLWVSIENNNNKEERKVNIRINIKHNYKEFSLVYHINNDLEKIFKIPIKFESPILSKEKLNNLNVN
jgi:hypothetical protein